ncbi:hypothetical protein EUAN_07330 [Andreesenia angusta]|uniref:Uncharacterized protein n=1 Tax=Andreesenia angusta TaxID=39480 RepID=A0A1S1VAT8_9FIRM|nr:hypothetical protein [Andreesenia angusta]OHW62949.1 hypothetical protein EUAN_07330 [Andreesenia angusta]
MENTEKVKDAFKKIKNGTVVFEKEEGNTVHFFILDSEGNGFKTSVDSNLLESHSGSEEELASSLDYSALTLEDIEFFKLGKKVYTLTDQGTIVALKKYIYKITG